MRIVLLLCALLCQYAWAQDNYLADRIIAVVDEKIIVESELKAQVEYLKKSGQKDDGTLECTVLENMISSRLLLAKARLDSVEVSEDRVESELERRLNQMERQLGSKEAIEEIAGTSYLQFKVRLRPEVEEQLLSETMRNKIYNEAGISPKDVKDYFASIPKDSIPLLGAQVSMSQIVIKSKPGPATKARTKARLEEIRREILEEGKNFSTMASTFSVDPGSRVNGGKLPRFCRGEMVPEFEAVAYSLTEGEVSEVFESPFGYHVIKLDKRIGNCIEARHILLIPRISTADELNAKHLCDSIRARIMDTNDTLNFQKAALYYSEDNATKNIGGKMRSRSGAYKISINELDAQTFTEIDGLKAGEVSETIEFINQELQTSRAYKILLIEKRYKPHRANLGQDYQRYYNAALTSKQNEILEKWILRNVKEVYIDLRYAPCSQALSHWNP